MRRNPLSMIVAASLLAAIAGMTALATPAQAATADKWDPGYIISDAQFYDTATMTPATIQDFLNEKGKSCVPGAAPCLKDYKQDTTTIEADAYCKAYQGKAGQSAAEIIWGVAQACGINPQVLIVTLQKEQTLVTGSKPSARAYETAMGFGCPDGAPCETSYFGFLNQVYRGARQFKVYAAKPLLFNILAGADNNIRFNPNGSCGSSTVFVQNQATASLYNYTPYQPNKAALANLYGLGDSCSAYGNRNFWAWYTDWFGDPTAGVSPGGYVDSASALGDVIAVRGWALDLDATKAQIEIHAYVGGPAGTGEGHNLGPASLARPELATLYPAAGPNHGFTATFTTKLTGTQPVYVYAINAPGTVGDNTLLTVAQVTIGGVDPFGTVDVATASAGIVTLRGWAIDADKAADAIEVHAYIGGPAGTGEGHNLGPANQSRPDVGDAYPQAGANHGYGASVSTKLTGDQTVYVYAINAPGSGGQTQLIAVRDVTIAGPPPAPFGSIDRVTARPGGFTMEGWAINPVKPTGPADLQVYVGGPIGTGDKYAIPDATLPRADVAAVYPEAGPNHAYSATVSTSKMGKQSLYLYATDATGTPALIGTTSVTITSADPFGHLDDITTGVGTIAVRGWAIDADAMTSAVEIQVCVGDPAPKGECSSLGTAVKPRPDVAKVYAPAGPNHGFDASVATKKTGTQAVYVYAINVPGSGGKDLLLASATVTIGDPPSPIGSIDAITGGKGSFLIQGWAINRGDPKAEAKLTVVVGGPIDTGESHALTGATDPRPDVGTVFPDAGPNHGYNATVTTKLTGAQPVYLYAANNAGKLVLIGQTTVTIG